MNHKRRRLIYSSAASSSRDSSRVRAGLVGARLRRHKVTGEQVGGVDEAVGLDVVGVVSGVPPQPVAECAGAHGGEFADPPMAYVAGVVCGKVRRVARFVAVRCAAAHAVQEVECGGVEPAVGLHGERNDLVAALGDLVAVGVELSFVGDVSGVSVGASGVSRVRGFWAGAARLPRGGDRVGGDDVDDDSASAIGVQGVRHVVVADGDVGSRFLSQPGRRGQYADGLEEGHAPGFIREAVDRVAHGVVEDRAASAGRHRRVAQPRVRRGSSRARAACREGQFEVDEDGVGFRVDGEGRLEGRLEVPLERAFAAERADFGRHDAGGVFTSAGTRRLLELAEEPVVGRSERGEHVVDGLGVDGVGDLGV